MAQAQAAAIEDALAFAEGQATQDEMGFPEGFVDSIVEGIEAWTRLKEQSGFNLEDVFRRRELIPFVLVPRHVSTAHGSAEKLSLFTHLQQAHDAFVMGLFFASLALMRSIMEIVLDKHYGSHGADLRESIDNCRLLPGGASKAALHRLRQLANDVLHFNEGRTIPGDFERELISLLVVLRNLIEAAPAGRAAVY